MFYHDKLEKIILFGGEREESAILLNDMWAFTVLSEILIPDTSAAPNDNITIPISITNAAGIAGIEMTVTYNSNILSVIDVQTAELTKHFYLADSISNGTIAISLASSTGITSNTGKIVNMTFHVHSEAIIGNTSHLNIEKLFLYNETTDSIPGTIKNGSLTIIESSQHFSALPNPFTPNNDGYNDYVEFKFPEMNSKPFEILLFNIYGRKVCHLKNSESKWYGNSDGENHLEPGVYIYMIRVNGQAKYNGTVTIML
jgi:gliding motility-associated-like protein